MNQMDEPCCFDFMETCGLVRIRHPSTTGPVFKRPDPFQCQIGGIKMHHYQHVFMFGSIRGKPIAPRSRRCC